MKKKNINLTKKQKNAPLNVVFLKYIKIARSSLLKTKKHYPKKK